MTRARLTWLVAAAGIAVAMIVGGLVVRGYELVAEPGPLQETTTIVVPRGSGLREISRRLTNWRVIEHPRLFEIYAWVEGAQHDLRAGEYAFDPGSSMKDVLTILREGRTVVHRVTLAEGLTSLEMVDVLNDASGLEGKLTGAPPDGALLPDTYHYSLGDKREEILDRMKKAMELVLADLWEQRAPDLPLKTPEEVVVLASIVEKETAIPEERARVAAVFINRLRKGMRLESDPTVVYGLTGGTGPLGRRLFRGDLKKEHAYNTYKIDGLPPGPICNPGRDSLAAVMNPMKTEELYFVADGSGGHVFAKTLDEHNRNVAAWRKLRRVQRQNRKK